jgi:predicted RNA polymerase sigma factor
MRPWNGRRAARPPPMALWKSGRSLPNSSGASKVQTSADELAHRAVEAAARQSYGRLVALLAARTRDPAGAEDALADALLAALSTWPRHGIPKNPQAWLLTAARNRLLDHARHLEVRERNASTLETLANELHEVPDPDALPDERLKLLFVCAHPAIEPDMHTPLMLQTVLGLDAVAIGRAFLVSPKAMGQRLVRAKTKIRQAQIAFEIPAAAEIPQRLEAVLNAIYAAYGSSWEDAAGRDQRAVGLAEEAIWLARVLRDAMPDEPEVRGLLACCFTARRGAPHAAARTAGSYRCQNRIPASGSRPSSTRPSASSRCRRRRRAWGASRSRRPFNRCTPSAPAPGARTGPPSPRSMIC